MKRGERGAALLTVLLLVAVMSVVAVSVIDGIRFSVRRTTNGEALTQARWYALSAEVLAGRQVAAGLPPGVLGEWHAVAVEGGTGQAKIVDGGACFNLNSVVEGRPGQWLRHEAALRQYRALLQALDVPERQSVELSEALADWIDSDQGRTEAGAEDADYQGYRTSGTLLSETSELRAVRGYDTIYRRIRPFVCALPTPETTVLNVNALAPDQAPLLTAITDNTLSKQAAFRLLSDRPMAGWPTTAAFKEDAEKLQNSGIGEGQLSVTPRYFGLTVKTHYQGAEVVMTSLLERRGEGVIEQARRWTVDE